MFEANEVVCIQNECGVYNPFVFKGYLDDERCLVKPKGTEGSVSTQLLNNVFKADDIIRLINGQITECHAMIDHFIKLNNKEEIVCWRKYLQKAKMDKRRLKNT